MEIDNLPEAHPTEADPPNMGRGQAPLHDLNSPEFAAEARRQCLLANASAEEAEIQAFIDSIYQWPDDEYSQ